jgi:acetyl-CoA carboxylase biotin carboxyl carrier protein
MSEQDLAIVRQALSTARRRGYMEVELKWESGSFVAKLDPFAPAQTTGQVAVQEKIEAIRATQVGYYRPAAKPLAVGDTVEIGDVVAVIAALGLTNELESAVSGEIIEVLVEPNQPVEFGQPLARVKLS